MSTDSLNPGVPSGEQSKVAPVARLHSIYELAAMLPEGISWHDPITPDMVQHIIALAAPAPVAPTSEPFLWVSPEQAAAHTNPDPDTEPTAGRYLPCRKTPAGKFTQPLYAAPVAPTPAQPSKTVPCEDCEGRGVVGEPVYQGAFQPPEHETCSSCDGSGVWQIAPRPAQPIQDKNPYALGSVTHERWDKGWKDARSGRARHAHQGSCYYDGYAAGLATLPSEPEGETP